MVRLTVSWYWDAGVNLHLDNHSNPLGSGYTVAELTEMVSDIPVSTIQVSALGNQGVQTTYPSQILPNSGGNWDTPGAWKQVAANLDRKFCIYMNSLGLAQWNQHPEWMRRKVDGEGYLQNEKYRMCVKTAPDGNSFLEKLLLPVLEEVVTKYKPDGIWMDGDWSINGDICWCDNCKKAWQIKTGKTTAPVGFDDPDWSAWLRFHYDRCYEYRKIVADAIHEIDTTCMYSSNGGWRIRSTIDDPRSAPGYVGTLTHDLSRQSALLRSRLYAMALSPEEETPHDIMHLITAGDAEITMPRLRQEAGLVLASGSVWFLWVGGTSIVDKRVQHRAKICAMFVRDRSDILGKSYSRNPIAVLASETSWERLRMDGKANYFEPITIENASLSLQDARFGVDIANEYILQSRWPLYRVVVIPDNQREILPRTLDNLKAFVEAGGLLLVMGSGMQYSQGKDRDIENLLGLKRIGTTDRTSLINQEGKTASFNSVWNIETNSAKVLATYRNKKAFLTRNIVGEGTVAYVSAASPFPYPDYDSVFAWIMDKLDVNPWIQIQNGDENKNLVFSYRSKPGRLFFHVVNLTSHVNGQKIDPHLNNAIDPVAVIPQLELSLDLPIQPYEVSVVPASSGVEHTWSNGTLDLVLTNVDYHVAVVIEVPSKH